MDSFRSLVLFIILLPMSVLASELDSSRILRDEFGFAQPMDAVTLKLPKQWLLKGAVQWEGRPECELERMKVHFMATSPDGKQWIEMIPGGVWGWGSAYEFMPQLAQNGFSGCDARPITNIQGFLQIYLNTIRPGATIHNMQMRPDLIQQGMRETNLRQGLQPGQQPRLEIAQADISYRGEGGTVNESLVSTMLFIDQPGPDPYGGMSGYTTLAWALGTLTMARVDGKPDMALMKRVGDSIKFIPKYEQQVTAYMKMRSQILAQAHARKRAAQQAWLRNRKAALASAESAFAQRQKQYGSSGKSVLDIQQETYENTRDMREVGQAKSVDTIHERTPWLNNEGKTIYMPQNYQRAYQLPNGVYAGTNDAFFNPVSTFGEFADPMFRSPR